MPADRRREAREAEDRSVQHLVELGYTDPTESTFAQAERRRQLRDKLRDAVELIQQGRAAEAVGHLERLAAADEEWAAPRRLLAEVHFFSGNISAAGPYVDWLALRNVVTPRLSLVTAAVAMQRGQWRSALVELEYGSHEDSSQPGMATMLGTAQALLGRWDEAEKSFENAVRLNAGDAAALDGLAAAALRRKDYQAAAHRALEALEHDMQLSRAHLHLGVALSHLNRPDAAAEALATCAKLEPERAAPLYLLSRLARARGDVAGAGRYRGRANAIAEQNRGGRRRGVRGLGVPPGHLRP